MLLKNSHLRRITAFLLSAGLFVSSNVLAFADDKEYDYIDSPVPEKVLVIGDSIATGYGLDGYDKGRENTMSYSNMLKADFESELKVGKEDFVNKAIDGQTSDELLDSLKKGEYDSLLKDRDLILISIGGNDLLHTLYGFFTENTEYGISFKELLEEHSLTNIIEVYSGLSKVLDEKIAAYGENLKEMFSYINSISDARVILQTVYNPMDTTEKPKLFIAFVKSKITGLNEQILQNAANEKGEDNYTVADIYEAFSGHGDTLTNIKKVDIHPNADGHKKIYETLDKLIRQTSYTVEVEKPKAEPAQAEPEDDNDSEGTSAKTLLLIGGGAVLVGAVVATFIFARKRAGSK
ncbi:MAG: hypothetical protein J6O40_02745 [Ruminococcus sp.]|nr:hypothetical protein [Ruminococcus sp.]